MVTVTATTPTMSSENAANSRSPARCSLMAGKSATVRTGALLSMVTKDSAETALPDPSIACTMMVWSPSTNRVLSKVPVPSSMSTQPTPSTEN